MFDYIQTDSVTHVQSTPHRGPVKRKTCYLTAPMAKW